MKEDAIGIDVSKERLDCAASWKEEVRSFRNSDDGIAELAQWARGLGSEIVALESTGKYHRRCQELLEGAGFSVRRVNPKRVRDYAKATGILAKTDKIDCKVIASYAAVMQPKEAAKLSENAQKLRELVERRQQLIALKTAELCRLECVSAAVKDDIQSMVRVLSARIQKFNIAIKRLLSEPEFASKVNLLSAVPAVGPVLTATLIATLPELGTLDKRKIAALAGVAPFNRDSGTLRGKRTVYGGRATVRSALYMATLVATRFNPWVRAFYEQLVARGKNRMTALVASMRKFLTALNAIIRDNRPWTPA